MPHSLRDNDGDVRDYVRTHDIRSVFDIGAGSGTYARLLRGLVTNIDAVEVWRHYVKEFALEGYYRNILIGDVRDIAGANYIPPDAPYDLIIFGDVLEHMEAYHGEQVWKWAKTVAKHGLISVPTVHWPQGEVNGNPFEAHVQDHLHADDYVNTYGPFDEVFEYEQTATFIVRF